MSQLRLSESWLFYKFLCMSESRSCIRQSPRSFIVKFLLKSSKRLLYSNTMLPSLSLFFR